MYEIIFRVGYRFRNLVCKILISWCLASCLLKANGQNPSMFDPDNGRASFGISVLGAVYVKTHISPGGGQYKLSSNHQLGYELILHYNFLFENNFLLSFGLGGNLVAYNFNYDIESDLFDPPTESNISSNKAASPNTDLFCLKVQAEIQRKIPIGYRKALSIGIGSSVLFAPARDEVISEYVFYPTGVTRYFLQRRQINGKNTKPWINFHASLGHDWKLEKGHSVGIFVKLNYSPARFVSGVYDVDPGRAAPTSGQYYVTGTYIGAGVNFTLRPR